MAVTGVLAADFRAFYDAVQQAEVHLKSMEAGGAKVQGQLTRMTESFSGRRVITEATLMAEVLDRAGGSSAFTERELARMGATGQEAAAKMRALGQEVPEGIERLARASERATPNVGGLKGELMKFDGLLASVGINASGPIRAIGEIGDMAGKSVTEVGLLGSAGAAFGAGIAGWKVGRLVADFFDLDEAIGNATAKLLGWGDVGAETAGAKADELNARLTEQANVLRRAAQLGEENNVVLSQAALEWNFAASAAEEAAYEYTVYGDVVNGIIQSTGEAIDASEAYRSELKFTTETVAEQTDAVEAMSEATLAAAEAQKVFQQTFTSDLPKLSDAQLSQLGGNADYNAMSGMTSEGNIRAKLQELEAAAARGPRGLFEGVQTESQYRAATAQQMLLEQLRQYFSQNSFADGVENYRGGMALVGERGPELVNLPRGSSVTPNHAIGGVTNFHFNLSGMVGDKQGLAKMIAAAFRELQMNQGSRLVARA